MTRIAVLGASTPFVLPFFDAMADQVDSPADLTLFGRNHHALELVAAAARTRLPQWQVTTTTTLGQAVAAAEIVVVQVRFGGLEGRQSDEHVAGRLGVPADETLGPAGLNAALRLGEPVRRLAKVLAASCPGALVINLMNPLSVTTSLLAESSLQVWGACELPVVTHRSVARILQCHPGSLSWAYEGLNHRGFLYDLRCDGEDVLPRLAELLSDRSALGVLGTEVTALSAVPLKYFGLFAGHAPHGAGRAVALMACRSQALDELGVDSGAQPRALDARPSPWYSEAVVPMISARITGHAVEGVANLAGQHRVVHEHRVVIGSDGCRVLVGPRPPAAVTAWVERFEEHERAVLTAVKDPSPTTIRVACELDPLLPAERVEEAVHAIVQSSATL